MVGRALANIEAVARAVRIEIEFAELYAALASRARNPDAKKLLRAMASDEELHLIELTDLYEGMLEGEESSIPPRRRERAKELGTEDYVTVFEGAYAKEVEA
jgi:rubrerythrin